jgi:hypothetical protein
MDYLTILFLTTLPAGISIMFLIIYKKDIKSILNKTGAGSSDNSIDLIKIIKTYRHAFVLEKNEKHLLIWAIICTVVGYFTILAWISLFLFFPDNIFGN